MTVHLKSCFCLPDEFQSNFFLIVLARFRSPPHKRSLAAGCSTELSSQIVTLSVCHQVLLANTWFLIAVCSLEGSFRVGWLFFTGEGQRREAKLSNLRCLCTHAFVKLSRVINHVICTAVIFFTFCTFPESDVLDLNAQLHITNYIVAHRPHAEIYYRNLLQCMYISKDHCHF